MWDDKFSDTSEILLRILFLNIINFIKSQQFGCVGGEDLTFLYFSKEKERRREIERE